MSIPNELANAAHAQQLEALRVRFILGLQGRLTEMQTAPDATTLHAALHRLAGAAGAFGFEHLGALARTALQTCDPAKQDGSEQPLPSVMQELTTAIHGLLARQSPEGHHPGDGTL